MNNTFKRVLMLVGAVALTPPCYADTHHGTNPNCVTSYQATGGLTSSTNRGISVAESENIVANGSHQQVVHLKAQGVTWAQCFISNTTTGPTQLNVALDAPIQFSVKNGDANRLVISLFYTTPDKPNKNVRTNWVTPTTTLQENKSSTMTVLGPGKYAIPVGANGVPSGSTLFLMFATLKGKRGDCTDYVTDFNELTINGFPVGIQQGSSTYGNSCGGGASE
ncbi:MAG TPA: hypothetical protein V6C76_05650 [Drouetiella sp.]